MVRLAAIGFLVGTTGCTTVLGIDGDYELGLGGGGAGGSGTGGSPCPGEDMVAFERFCIDRTEVSEGAYQAFIASGETPALRPARCDDVVDFSPGSSSSADGALPVTQVTFCDAHAYCAWAGKELCGRPGGGNAAEATDPAASAWYAVCSGDGARTFPYGDDYVKGRCVDAAAGNEPVAGGSTDCATPEGVVHLVGNVREWESACDHPVFCRARGGSFRDSQPDCTTAGTEDHQTGSDDLGFRCCAPLE